MPRALLLLALTAGCLAAAKPEFQYQSGDIAVSIPTADEPRVASFGAESVRAAGRYLEQGALAWVREKSCINCHTTGPYLAERPALAPYLGAPNEEILADFLEAVPATVKPQQETEKNGHRYYAGSWTAIWRSLGLAEWDRHVRGKLAETTDRSLRDMFERQSPSGGFVSYGEVEIPHITTDFELSVQAARAIAAAPGWLAGLKDPVLRERVERLKTWLREAAPKNDYDRILRLQLAQDLPELVTTGKRDDALTLLAAKQHADGGWSTRDFSAVMDWHFTMSETVLKLIASLPDAGRPESDAYMTAFAVVLMRQNGVPAADERVQRAVAWLKREQRVSGRWWMHSLYRGNYHYITYIATAQALKALALCDALPVATTGN